VRVRAARDRRDRQRFVDLPYRLHARRDQVAAAYPNVARFIERKRHYDPRLLFRNAMWQGYFANECAPLTCG